jgi:hypothetical protein
MQPIDILEVVKQWQNAEFRSQIDLILKREAHSESQQCVTQMSSADESGDTSDEGLNEGAPDSMREITQRARTVDTTESDTIEIKMETEDDTMFQIGDTAEALDAEFTPAATSATSQDGGQPDFDNATVENEGSEDEDAWFDAPDTTRAMTITAAKPPPITGKRKRASPASGVNDSAHIFADADAPLVPTMKLHFESYMVRYQRVGLNHAKPAILELLKGIDIGYFLLMGEHLPWPDEPWGRQAQEEVKFRVLAEKHIEHLGEPTQHLGEPEAGGAESHKAKPRDTSSAGAGVGRISRRPFGRR